MRKDTRRNKTERPSGNNPKPGTVGRKPPRDTSPQHTDAQRETMQTGLRVLARMIARTHLKRQAEPGELEPPPEPEAGG